MSLSIYTSFYNVERMKFAWREALSNWLSFLHGRGQIVIALNTSDDNSGVAIRAWLDQWRFNNPASGTKVDIVETSIPYSDPAFDGKIKAAALDACTEPYAVLLDCDERVCPFQFKMWLTLADELSRSPLDAFLIPVVDLIGTEKQYKSVGSKFYLHKRLPHITRGVVAYARREDGSIDTSKSDTTEPIYRETGQLVSAAPIIGAGLPDYIVIGQLEGGWVPFVTHLGWLDAEQRLRQAEFWRPVWDARNATPGKEPVLTLEALDAIPRYRHHLPSWRDGTENMPTGGWKS